MTVHFNVSESEEDRIRSLIQRLLAINFLNRETDRDLYSVLRRNSEQIQRYFSFLGWDLILDERHECVYLHVPQSALRRTLDKEESIWLLVLRLLYQEKRQGISLSELPLVTLHEIRTKFETFRISLPGRTKLDKLIRLCMKYQLIDPIDTDWRSDECRFKLYHTWMYVIQIDDIQKIVERIERYEIVTEGSERDEVAETFTIS